MNLPDNFACGMFDVPIKVAKIARLAASTTGNEREVARKKLLKFGYFLDRVGILWEKDKVPELAKDKTLEISHV